MNILGIFWLNLRLEKARGPIAAAREEMRGTKLKGGGGGPEIQYWKNPIFLRIPLQICHKIFLHITFCIFFSFSEKNIYFDYSRGVCHPLPPYTDWSVTYSFFTPSLRGTTTVPQIIFFLPFIFYILLRLMKVLYGKTHIKKFF